MNTPPDNYAAALRYAELGYSCIPLRPGSKAAAIRWKAYQVESPTPEDYERWFKGTRNNIALVCGELVVVDVDSPDLVDRVLECCGRTPSMSRSPGGGFHLPYRARKGVRLTNKVGVRGMEIDLRVAGGYSVEAGSVSESGVPYVWLQELVPLAELPVFRVTWTRERVRRVVTPEVVDDADRVIRRARRYLASVEGTITGQGGCHNKTFRVACVLCHKFGLTPERAFPLMWEWNVAQCEPPWSEAEIRHKLIDAWKKRA